MIQRKVSVPCLFYGANITGNIVEFDIDVHEVARGSALIGSRLESRIVDEELVQILYASYRHFMETEHYYSSAISLEINNKNYAHLQRNKIFIEGASFSFGLLAGMYLLGYNCTWPEGVYTSAEISFNHKDKRVKGPKITPIGAASQKAKYVFEKAVGNILYMPYDNVRSLIRSRKWRGKSLSVLPIRLSEALSFFCRHSKERDDEID